MRTRFLPPLAIVFLVLLGACSGGDAETGGATSPAVIVPPGDTAAAASPTAVPASDPIRAPFDLPIVMYHDVSGVPPDDIYRAGSNVLPADFSAQLDYLECAGYTTISMAQLFDAVEGRSALPEKPVILTFDDGYTDHYTEAFPLLRAHSMNGSFAIITGFVEGGGDYMSWAQIKEMADAGMEMMSHTVTHIDMNTSDDATVADQLAASRTALELHTGKAPDFLVYPAGEPFRSGTVERQVEVASLLEVAGYRGALLAGPSSVTQDPAQPFALNRVRVGESTDLASFAALIGGPPPGECGGRVRLPGVVVEP